MSTTDPTPTRPRAEVDMTRVARTTAMHILLSGIAFTMTLPFLWMLLSSFKTAAEIGAESWFPETPQWGNYGQVFEVVNFARFYGNTLFTASYLTFLQVLTSAMAAYAFARLEWPGRDKVFLLYLSTMMVPPLVLMIPLYQLMIQIGLVDTLTGLILGFAFTPFGTFLLRQFMLTLPRSLDEAAKIDGANHWQVFWEVILPLARPGLITLAIFTFVSNFQNLTWPLVMLRSVHKYTLSIGLLYFDSTRTQSTHLLMAAVTMSVVPMIIFFVLLQKQLVRGIQLGAVKG